MKKQHILVVEDDAEMRETLSDILLEEGYEVKTTGRGKEAVTLAREEKAEFPLAICLIDLKLPDIDGIRVLEEIKHINPGAYAIIMTAFASKDTAIEALKAGAYSYIEKPVNMEELLHVIKKATESYQLLEKKKRVEDKIKELAEIHTDLRERAPVAIVNVYEDYSVDCTDRLLEWTGWSREEMEHINLVKESRFVNVFGNEVVLPPLVAAEMIEKTEKEYIPKLMRGETLEGVYQCYNCKDGGAVPLELNSVGYFGGKEPKTENFVHTICIFSNITERKKAEETLKKSEQRYRRLFEAANDGIYTLDLNGNFTSGNRGTEEISGYKKEEFLGKSISCMLTEEELKAQYEKIKQIAAGQRIPPYETEIITKEGSVKPLELSIHSIEEEGKITGVLGIAQDITERKRAEDMLHESEEKYRTLFENTGTAMAILEEDTTISLCNKEFEELSGYSKAEIEGKKSWAAFVHSDDLEKMRRHYEERRKEGRKAPTSSDFKFIDRKGNINDIYLAIEMIPGTKKSVASLIDITERKKAEEALRQKSEEQKVLLSTIPAFVYFKDRNDRYVAANRAFADMTGTPIDEIAGKTDYDFFPREEAEFYRKCDQEVMRAGEPKYNIEETVTGAEGKKMWVSTSKTPLFDSNGNVIGMVGITLDITERKRVEETLKREKNFSANVITTVPDSLLVLDANLRIKSANRSFYEKFQTEPDEVIGSSIADILQDGDGKLSTALTKLFGTGDMLENFELHYQSEKLGERIFNITARGMLIEEEEEEEEEVIVMEDITERKRAEENIKQAEKEWRDSFSSLADVMIVADTNFTIERINKAAEELVGKPREEIIGMKCYNVFHNIDNPPRNCPLKKSLKTKKVETVERYEQKFGRYFSVKSSPVLDENGEIIKFVDLMSDITERKRAEKEVKKYTKELERVNRDLEDFTSTVSHDLKAPLRSIQAFSMLLVEDYASSLDDTGRGYLDKVKEATERMSAQIEDLLTLSRVGRKFIEVETVDMNELLEEIKTDLSARIEERGGEVVVGKLPPVSTQRVWLKELFTNLIDNGLKFNKSDKPTVEVNGEEREKDYLFKVKDNGIGIEEKHLDNIFSLFERLHSQSEYEGTGAGLAICKKIVEGLGGDIWVESKPGEGCTFFFTIPTKNC